MENTIDRVRRILNDYSAQSWFRAKFDNAEQKQGVKFDEWLQIMYGSGKTGKQTCIDRFKLSCYNEYADMIKKYTGFIENGKVFVLDKDQKHIYFLYKSDKQTANIYTHHNPFNYDCIEAGIKAEWFNKEVISEKYIISIDEDYLITELNKL
jgi:hypothetical protein